MTNLISRADAIGAWDKLSKRGRTEFDQVLMTLPSADAYFTDGNKIGEWITCSERLPSESGNYLITVADLRHWQCFEKGEINKWEYT